MISKFHKSQISTFNNQIRKHRSETKANHSTIKIPIIRWGFYLHTHKIWSWNLRANLLISSLEWDIWFWWEREGCWWESERAVLPNRTKKMNRKEQRKKNKESSGTAKKRQGKYLGCTRERGLMSHLLDFYFFKKNYFPPFISLYSRKA